MPDLDLRAQARAEYVNAIWSIRADALVAIRGYLTGAISLEEARALASIQTVPAEPAADQPAAIAVIALHGLITPQGSFLQQLFGAGGGLQSFRAQLADAVADPAITGIILDIDSPGGLSSLNAETAADVYAARQVKPIAAIANTMCASAAYFIGSQADELVVTPSGYAGSIGAFCTHEDWSAYEERLGVKTTLISAGKFKTEGNMHEPLSDEARAAAQQNVDACYDLFVEAVARGRGVPEADVRSGFGEGRCLDAAAAVAAGLADAVESFEDLVARMLADGLTRRDGGAGGQRAIEPATSPVLNERQPELRHATFEAHTRAADTTGSRRGIATVNGRGVVFGSRNTFGEVFVPGSMSDTLATLSDEKPLPMVDSHRQAVGRWTSFSETREDLELDGFISDTAAGRDVLTLLKDKAINGLSVGYLPDEVYLASPNETVSFDTPFGRWTHTETKWTFYILKATLGEVSIVYAPSDPKARVLDVRGISAEQLGQQIPSLAETAPWARSALALAALTSTELPAPAPAVPSQLEGQQLLEVLKSALAPLIPTT